MTPEQRAKNSAEKWLKIACREMVRVSDALQVDLDTAGFDEGNTMRRTITDLRAQAKRCAHHGLGMTVQQLLPLQK